MFHCCFCLVFAKKSFEFVYCFNDRDFEYFVYTSGLSSKCELSIFFARLTLEQFFTVFKSELLIILARSLQPLKQEVERPSVIFNQFTRLNKLVLSLPYLSDSGLSILCPLSVICQLIFCLFLR